MHVVSLIALAVGFALLVIGSRKHHRHLLAASAPVLVVASGRQHFVKGFRKGMKPGREAAVEAPVAHAAAP
jgi:hypothetical protein